MAATGRPNSALARVRSALVIDAYAGLITGWQCSTSKEITFVQSAITQAAALRARQSNPLSGNTVHHSDAGSQYTAIRFTESLMLAGLTPSIGTVGDCLLTGQWGL